MPLIGFHCPGNPFAVKHIKDCEACDHPCFPDGAGSIEHVRWVWHTQFGQPEHYHDDPMVLSVTECMRGACLRKAWFERKRSYAETPASLAARTDGTGRHASREAANGDGFSEVVLSRDLGGGYTLKGTADRLTPDYIVDYKFVDRVRKTYDEQHAEQLNIYNQMAGGGRRMYLDFCARKDVARLEVHEIEDALGVCLDRAGRLIAALAADDPASLEPEGRDIHFFKAIACDFCPHRDECEAIDGD